MNLLANFETPLSNPLQRPHSGDFNPENAYRKPHVKIVPEAGYDVYTGKIDQ
jgi:hypothetical protein